MNMHNCYCAISSGFQINFKKVRKMLKSQKLHQLLLVQKSYIDISLLYKHLFNTIILNILKSSVSLNSRELTDKKDVRPNYLVSVALVNYSRQSTVFNTAATNNDRYNNVC